MERAGARVRHVHAGVHEPRPTRAGDDGCEPDLPAEANPSRAGLNGAWRRRQPAHFPAQCNGPRCPR